MSVFLLCLHQDPMGLTNADNAFTLYYVKFRAAAPKVNVSIMFVYVRLILLRTSFCLINVNLSSVSH